jgi:multiple sugar transport system substrate-binding protein
MKQRTSVRAALLVAAAALAFAGCTGGGSSTATGSSAGGEPPADLAAQIAAVTPEQLEGTILKVADYHGECPEATEGVTDVSKGTNQCDTFGILVNAFNAAGTGITAQRVASADWNDYMAAIDTAFAGHRQPDVIEMNGSRMAPYASRGLLLPIEMDAYGVDIPDLTDAGAAAAMVDGTQYAIPFDIAAELINVNLDILGDAGVLDADGAFVPPTSVEEFTALCKTIKDKTGKQPFGLAFVDDMASTWLFMTGVWQQGGDFVTADGSAPTVNTDEAVAALQFLDDLIDLGYVNKTADYATSNQDFLNGDVAMVFNGGWEVNNYATQATFDYYATDFPNLWGTPVVLADSDVWTIARNADDDPVTYRAALEFLKFLADNNAGWAQGTGLIPVTTEVLASDGYRSLPQRANYLKTAESYAHMPPQVANYSALESALRAGVTNSTLNGVDPATALKEAQAQAEMDFGR